MEFNVSKKYARDAFDLVVFSPLSGTQFSLGASCEEAPKE
jgi:hypothetical protein